MIRRFDRLATHVLEQIVGRRRPEFDLFRDAERALSISPLRDLCSAKDTYISLVLTNGVSLTWLSEQTDVAVATILIHYGAADNGCLSCW